MKISRLFLLGAILASVVALTSPKSMAAGGTGTNTNGQGGTTGSSSGSGSVNTPP